MALCSEELPSTLGLVAAGVCQVSVSIVSAYCSDMPPHIKQSYRPNRCCVHCTVIESIRFYEWLRAGLACRLHWLEGCPSLRSTHCPHVAHQHGIPEPICSNFLHLPFRPAHPHPCSMKQHQPYPPEIHTHPSRPRRRCSRAR